MKWTGEDVAIYERERDYIDTALLPLLPVAFGQGTRRLASGGELVQLIAAEVERQLRGRVFLLPPFVYFADEPRAQLVERLSDWTSRLEREGMRQVFYVTCDRAWQEEGEASRVWLIPAVPLESMEESYKHELVREQAAELLRFLVGRWAQR
ncbi:YpiF family protein [Geobacillus jurassicus]|uniref:YpiF family protein n=1 Tax=Geobacillus jurassicus TaxID=235932 RepID=A0ABV6GVI8_9BACL|nr:YpiF family protein [Geobacillus jurassicus]